MKSDIESRLSSNDFVPPSALRNGHVQTIAAALIPRQIRLLLGMAEPRVFEPEPGVKVLGSCSWHRNRKDRPTVVVIHGMEGSADSPYMQSTAECAVSRGFNVVRLNIRNCGGTESMSPTLYHAGLTIDARSVIAELSEKDGLNEIYLVGFSLGGNIVLKLAGEYGAAPPKALRGVAAISPSIDLTAAIDAIEARSNLLYHLRFVRSLRTRLRRKASFFPDRYDVSRLAGIWSIREFDDAYTAPHCGFEDSGDYYRRASALPFISRITVPTLIIHAKDDPFIPYAPLERSEVKENPNVFLLAPECGGHVAFVSRRAAGVHRFWAEAKACEFVSLVATSGA
ncbi:MAG TPA: alpha/beta fold hydrolase [Blastocatellia bacterium]